MKTEKELENCKYKNDLGDLLNILNCGSLEQKTIYLKNLKENPSYYCYFCDGYNYNCNAYEVSK